MFEKIVAEKRRRINDNRFYFGSGNKQELDDELLNAIRIANSDVMDEDEEGRYLRRIKK